jgi:PAS domain S-box-containing protein
MMETYPGFENTEIFARLKNCMESHMINKIESEYVFPDGAKEWLEIVMHPLKEGVFILSLSINDRKKLEEKESMYNAQNAELAAVVEFSEDAIIGWGLGGIVTSWNKGAEKIYGYTAQEMIGNSIGRIITPYNPNELPAILKKNRQGETIKHFETVRVKKDGSHVLVSVSISPIKNAEGKIIGASTIGRDITERKELEEVTAKASLVTALEAANKDLEAFCYSISHDLRGPLRSIDGFSKILDEDYTEKLDDNGRRVIVTIRDSVKQMGQLIDDLLTFSRLGRKAIKREDVGMTALVTSVFDEQKLLIPGQNITFTCAELPNAYVDGSLFREVWANLLSNAIKYTKKKEDAVIVVGSKSNAVETTYYIQDNGVGFDMKDAGKLFGAFQRLQKPQDFEGTGVGLAIVARIITNHGGKVWAEGKVDQGAIFYFSLPNTVTPLSKENRDIL